MSCKKRKPDSYDVVAEAVREYWKENYPEDMVAFFYQKYEYESDKEWEWKEELVECEGDCDYENMTFLYDFCEGQTCVKGLTVVPLRKVTAFYAEHFDLWRTE